MLDLASSPIFFLIYFACIVVAITIHEFAHAWAADKLGDPTPRLQGRLSLNPLSHLDPLGTITLILFRIGWGKPVQFDPYNLKNPVRDSAIISLAGPVSNLLLAFIVSLLLKSQIAPFLHLFALPLIAINVGLAIFNLIPIYPLDGSKILFSLLPSKLADEFDLFMRQYGQIVLLLVILPFFGQASLASQIVSPAIDFILSLLLGTSSGFV